MSTHPAPPSVPTDCWYAVGSSASVGHSLRALVAQALPVVLFRTSSGEVAALEDRCAHRAYPLSAGSLANE